MVLANFQVRDSAELQCSEFGDGWSSWNPPAYRLIERLSHRKRVCSFVAQLCIRRSCFRASWHYPDFSLPVDFVRSCRHYLT